MASCASWRLLLGAAVSVCSPAIPAALAQASADPASLEWSTPTTLPLGALAAVASGDPGRPGTSTFLLSMPDGYRVPPHFHPRYERLEVMEGTLLVGMGDVIDLGGTRAMTAGDSMTAAPGVHHFWIAKGRRTVLALSFDGPYTITYLHAEDAPRARNFPFGY